MMFVEPLITPIIDVINLHVFRLDEVSDLLCDYLDACLAKGRAYLKKGSQSLKKTPAGQIV